MDGFQIDSVKKLVDQVLNKYPKASIAVESDDVLYSNFNVEHLWPGTDYIITAADLQSWKEKGRQSYNRGFFDGRYGEV